MKICSFLFAFLLVLMLSCYFPSAHAQPDDIYPTANLSTTWNTSQHTYQPMLLRETNVGSISCSFVSVERDTPLILSGYIFAISIEYKLVWSANQDYPVQEDAILNFTAAGELVLRDVDGSIVWTTNTTGKAVAGMNLTNTGNLVLFDHQNKVVWQSFDHPTDGLLLGQKLFTGQSLTASVSTYNSSKGMYYLQVKDKGLFAYVESNPPQAYYSRFIYPYGNHNTNKDRKKYIRFLNGSLSFFIHSSELSDPDAVIDIPQASSAQYIQLMPNGSLLVFELHESEWTVVADLTEGYVDDDCSYPLFCKRNSICSPSHQCSCPGHGIEYFRPVDDREPELGCSEITPVTCNSAHDKKFITLQNIKYFTLIADITGVNVDTCKQVCHSNCSCKAAFFEYDYSSSVYGNCFLTSEIFTMNTVDPNYGASAFIKVQNVKSPSSHDQAARVVGSTIGSIVFLLVVAICFIMYVVYKRKRDAEMEEDFLDQVPGMPTRFSYEELNIATENFSKKLGEGGFGSVFEGCLKDRSKTS